MRGLANHQFLRCFQVLGVGGKQHSLLDEHQKTHSSTFSVHSLSLLRGVMQPEETIKLSSDYSTSRIPPSPPPLYPACPPPIALSPSRRNISNMTHLSLYLCPEYLCGHVRGQKGLHCFPHHHHPLPTPTSLPFSAPLQPPGRPRK